MTDPSINPSYSEPRDWYAIPRWRRRAKHQLLIEPLCAICKSRGVNTPACVVDHIEPHKGDWNAFWLSKVQSLCKRCHDSTKRVLELRGYDPTIDASGYPVDQRHPVYNNDRKRS